MDSSYLFLGIAALLPVALAAVIGLLERFVPQTERVPRWLRQAVIGILFGGLAVVGTEWGIPMNGAQVNARDAAVLIGGLMFGGPAGIIAGVIGGLERWIAVAWGVGTFTRVACSVSTLIAGLYAALLRKFMFENKRPGTSLALAIGIVMEVLHLSLVFLTNMAEPVRAMGVVKICTLPMLLANGVSVMLSAFVLARVAGEPLISHPGTVRISQTIQRWLLVAVVLAFVATSLFVYSLQTQIADRQTASLLSLAQEDIAADVRDASDANMLKVCNDVLNEQAFFPLTTIARHFDVAEIDVVDKNGIITDSTNPNFIGFDMSSGEQSREFLCLLKNEQYYVQEYGPISYDNTIYRKYAGLKTSTGFIQVGYNAKQFQQDIDEQIIGLSENSRIGQNGFVLLLNSDLHVVSGPRGYSCKKLEEEISYQQIGDENQIFNLRLDGKTCCCSYRMAEGFYILSVLPQTEALQMRDVAMYVNTFMEILVFAILFGLIYLLIKKVVVNRIMDINHSLARITGGNLDTVVNVRSNTEFASLSDDINTTVDTLKHYIDEAAARIDKELEFAKNIQSSALPNVTNAFARQRQFFDIFASMNAAKEVGGDFYDAYMTSETMLHFLIADVSGKGIPAAMFMMRAKTELRSLTEAGQPINDVFTHGNAALCEGNDAGMFVTAWQGNLDLSTGLVRFANAGHNPPLVRHAGGKFEYLKSRAGFVLAGMDGVCYKTQELQLQPGDEVFLYTDGVTEATDLNNELFGEDRLLESINAKEFSSMEELCHHIRAEVDAFVGEAPQFDDITMVALRYLEKK